MGSDVDAIHVHQDYQSCGRISNGRALHCGTIERLDLLKLNDPVSNGSEVASQPA